MKENKLPKVEIHQKDENIKKEKEKSTEATV